MSQKIFELHPLIFQYLRRISLQDRLPSAFLFYGPRGVGKFEFAIEFCRFLFCESYPQSPCEKCKTCRLIEKKQFPEVRAVDFQTIKKGSDKIIERAREIRREAAFQPVFFKKKVFILRNIEFLSPEAANALLKILEEPPPWCYFILTTDKFYSLLDTIISRCWKIYFPPVRREIGENFIREKYNVDKLFAREIYLLTEGRIFTAMEFMDDEHIKEQKDILKIFFSHSVPEVKRIERDSFRNILIFLIKFFKDVVLYKGGREEHYIFHPLKTQIATISSALSFQKIFDIIDAIFATAALWESINVRLAIVNLWEAIQCPDR